MLIFPILIHKFNDFQVKFLMRNLNNIKKIIWDGKGSWTAYVILTKEVRMGALPFNHDN